MTVALHEFGADGRCVNVNYAGKMCGKRFSDISFAAYDPQWLGQTDISCRGALLETEQTEIARKIDGVWSNVVGAASGEMPRAPQEPDNEVYVKF